MTSKTNIRTTGPYTILACLVVFFGFICLPAYTAQAYSGPTKTVTDGTGRVVKVPVDPKKIACFFGPSYEKTFLLGSADRVAAMSISQSAWAHKLNPALKNVTVMPSYSDPDVEKILQLGIDLVFYWQWPKQIEKMTSAGVPVVSPMQGNKNPETSAEFIKRYKDEIRFYGTVLGDKASRIAEEYCTYFDKKISQVTSISAIIPANKRPSVYYITGRNVFATQGGNTTGHWLIEMAGGNHVAKSLGSYFVDVSMEQIIAWNPDIIIVGGMLPLESVTSDPRWKSIKAVREDRVYPCPEGVFSWGHGSSELHLFVMWLAKTLHPDRFSKINLEKETIDYYSRFYHNTLSATDARRIIEKLPPVE
jgi:iron complex transport system substrate-binding protein